MTEYNITTTFTVLRERFLERARGGEVMKHVFENFHIGLLFRGGLIWGQGM